MEVLKPTMTFQPTIINTFPTAVAYTVDAHKMNTNYKRTKLSTVLNDTLTLLNMCSHKLINNCCQLTVSAVCSRRVVGVHEWCGAVTQQTDHLLVYCIHRWCVSTSTGLVLFDSVSRHRLLGFFLNVFISLFNTESISLSNMHNNINY